MKKAILTAVALMIGVSAFSFNAAINPAKEFQKYIIQNLSYNTSFASEGVEGTIKVKLNVTTEGVVNAEVISGVDPKIDAQVLAIAKNTPVTLVNKLSGDKTVNIVLSVKLVSTTNYSWGQQRLFH